MSETNDRLTRDEIKDINECAGKRHVQFFFKRPPKGTRLETRLVCTRAVIRDQKWFLGQKVDK